MMRKRTEAVKEERVAVIAIAALPGSGKSRMIQSMERDGFKSRDDMNRDWKASMQEIRQWLQGGERIVISDIEFCRRNLRERLQGELAGVGVDWVFFENAPYKCMRNVLYRFFIEGVNRPWQQELNNIQEFSSIFEPVGDVRSVVLADSTAEGMVRIHGNRNRAIEWANALVAEL
jgi:hypothetical protein